MLADTVSDEGLLPCSLTAVFMLCPHMAEGARELSWATFIRVLIPFIRAPPLRPNHLQKTPPSNTINLGIRWLFRP